ncbi:D-xylose 1-dehydrogenase (NADP(+)) [Lachnellula suecica]|uniref:D-xylose 1-dehydrogenase (NADP(+), D-xylono-1,5-lactone-forming) n=1 Tax=Lachnellula suecica TaxID=602035 RepID=A0A8T9CJK5_9HELO|nr:D-xylose 1-dehydrogenase (NADP(+)) [Lachnellula suecica]
MGAFLSLVIRCWRVDHPPERPKSAEAIRIGILGTGWIPVRSLITPAKSHAEVIVAAVASRDKTRAEAYARRFNIPIAYGSYQDMLDDPAIDAIYNPLPNSEHFEWSIRALKAGKHVLLEKPSVSNAIEAEYLFNYHSSLPSPRPVLLEAFHNRFHPAWHTFLSFISPPDVVNVESNFNVPSGFFSEDNCRWKFELSGGSLMDIGSYLVLNLRDVFKAEPVEVVQASARPSGYGDVDAGFKAQFKFPNGGVGSIDADMGKNSLWGVPWVTFPKIVVQQREIEVKSASAEGIHTKKRTIIFWGWPGPMYYHRIQVVDEYILRRGIHGEILRTWTEKKTQKAYVWTGRGEQEGKEGEPYWSTYRHMLEQFVNRVKGRDGSGVWFEGQDSIHQMKAIDAAFKKADMPIRPTSTIKIGANSVNT